MPIVAVVVGVFAFFALLNATILTMSPIRGTTTAKIMPAIAKPLLFTGAVWGRAVLWGGCGLTACATTGGLLG